MSILWPRPYPSKAPGHLEVLSFLKRSHRNLRSLERVIDRVRLLSGSFSLSTAGGSGNPPSVWSAESHSYPLLASICVSV
jgi:hypothetical protein